MRVDFGNEAFLTRAHYAVLSFFTMIKTAVLAESFTNFKDNKKKLSANDGKVKIKGIL